jgi:thiosulfate/3-mercaptopyruvate sulfurtransferase
LLPPEYLRNALTESVGVEQADAVLKGLAPVITSCGSGMTAGVVWLGLKLLGVKQISLYDEVRHGDSFQSSVLIRVVI